MNWYLSDYIARRVIANHRGVDSRYVHELQFSSLEPEVVCRLVYVKDVQLSQPEAGDALAGAPAPLTPPAGLTELPSCPVCLERLDEHISGVVTTVGSAPFS